MPCRAPVKGAAAASFHVLGHVRRHLHMPALENEVLGVVPFVRPNCNPSRAGNLLQHDQGRIPFCRTVGLQPFRLYDESVAQIAVVAQFGFLALAFSCQPRVLISAGFVRIVAAAFPTKIHRRIAGIIWGRTVLLILSLKALQTRPGFDQRSVHPRQWVRTG